MYLLLVLIVGLWFAWRQPETLTPERRVPFSLVHIARAVREVFRLRKAFGYLLTIGLVQGAFIGYLNSAPQVFQKQYGLGRLFSLYFAMLALSIGSASFLNARLVMRFGMRILTFKALQGITILSFACLGVATLMAGHPPLWLLTLYFLLSFFGVGILFGNLNALAMEPLGHIAGVGAAIIGSLSTFLSLSLGTLVGQSYNGTVLPLVGGFAVFSAIAIGIMLWVEGKTSVVQTD
jgi:DHA1 family bicyclomycin/chloramphenicol resistance-like MFS transporter